MELNARCLQSKLCAELGTEIPAIEKRTKVVALPFFLRTCNFLKISRNFCSRNSNKEIVNERHIFPHTPCLKQVSGKFNKLLTCFS